LLASDILFEYNQEAFLTHSDGASMTTSVLVPLDGTEKDERALPAAAALADLTGGDLHLIRVFDTPTDNLSARAGRMGVLDAAREIRSDMERSVRGRADRLSADIGRPVSAEVAEGFDVARTLVDRASEADTDLVVMATRAAGQVGRALRGSVADRVMRESPKPVVLIPPGASDTAGKQIRLGRVLVPLDGSELALRVIDHLLALPKGRELEYVLVEVITSGFAKRDEQPASPALEAYAGLPDIASARQAAAQRLRDISDRLRARGAKHVEAYAVEAADPAAAINLKVRELLVDFIAMGTRGSSGVKRFVLGSVAERVVRESEVPVLLVAPHEA
jgi:nucleotide-binding universal stress UspA family protein